MIAVTANI